MAKKEFAKNEKKKAPFNVLRKGALCALAGATILAGGLLVGCDEEGVTPGPAGVNFYYGTENPEMEGKVGDFYIETDDGDVWQLKADGWKVISNIKGPQGAPGSTPTITISNDGYWVIDGEVTNKKAVGEDGEDAEAPVITISEDGYWEINGDKTTTKAKGEKGDTGAQGVGIENVTIDTSCDADGNVYMDYTFHYTNDTTTSQRVYPNSTIYVGTSMTMEKALEVVAVGGTIQLKNDVELEKVTTINKVVTIDLAGHYIYNETAIYNDAEGFKDWSLISVREGGDLTITDSGAEYKYEDEYGTNSYIEYGGLVAMENDCFAIDVQEGGKCTINAEEETMFVGNISAVYVHTGELVVNGGMFAVQQLAPETNDASFTLNCRNENYKNGTAKITVNAGYFINCNPAKAGDDGNYVSEGNIVIDYEMEEGIDAHMVAPQKEAIEMLTTIPAGLQVRATLASDIVLDEQLIISANLILDLNGYTISNTAELYNEDIKSWSLISVQAGGNLTITGNGTLYAKENDCFAIDVRDGGKVTIENGTFIGNISAVYVHAGEAIINGGQFKIQQLSVGTTDSYCLTINCYNENYINDTANITINGGTYVNYNPTAYTNSEGNFLASGLTVESNNIEGDIVYTVVPEGIE